MPIKWTESKAWMLIISSTLFGGCSMVLFTVFLFVGGFETVDLRLFFTKSLIFDGLLCMLFFIQHSVMVRPFFRTFLVKKLNPLYYGGVYAALSGVVLLALVLLWQKTDTVIYSLTSIPRIAVHGIFFLTALPCYLCFKALDSFDALGLNPVLKSMGRRANSIEKQDFVVKGPYKWVRHPIYTSCIIAIWACPVLSFDRLLFDILWTVWIIMGSHFEESDLLARFGEPYRLYQLRVPMLIPRVFGSRRQPGLY